LPHVPLDSLLQTDDENGVNLRTAALLTLPGYATVRCVYSPHQTRMLLKGALRLLLPLVPLGEIVIALITLGLVFGADHWYHL
jgi:hypothetical protein